MIHQVCSQRSWGNRNWLLCLAKSRVKRLAGGHQRISRACRGETGPPRKAGRRGSRLRAGMVSDDVQLAEMWSCPRIRGGPRQLWPSIQKSSRWWALQPGAHPSVEHWHLAFRRGGCAQPESCSPIQCFNPSPGHEASDRGESNGSHHEVCSLSSAQTFTCHVLLQPLMTPQGKELPKPA